MGGLIEIKVQIQIQIQILKIKSVCLTANFFVFGELLDKAPSNQGLVLLVGLLLRRSTFTPVSLRGPAPNGHPCPDGALAASMRLGPLRKTCVQPAPKSRLAVTEHLCMKIKSAFRADQKLPAEAVACAAAQSELSGRSWVDQWLSGWSRYVRWPYWMNAISRRSRLAGERGGSGMQMAAG
jgi:hypothetical protein